MSCSMRKRLSPENGTRQYAKKLMLSGDRCPAGITDDFLHMDKLQFLPPCKVCNGAATGFHYGKSVNENKPNYFLLFLT